MAAPSIRPNAQHAGMTLMITLTAIPWTYIAKGVPEHRTYLWYTSPAGPERQLSAGSALSCSSISRSSRGNSAELATSRA